MKQEKITKFIKSEDADKKWYLVDAKDQVLGRLASEIAKVIRGKNKAIFTPNTDTGDFVIVINADQVKVTGKRGLLKTYSHHSGYPGGLKTKSFEEIITKKPEFIIESAVRGMLPKTRLGNKLIKKLKVYAGQNHPHVAQRPEQLNLMEK
ncbi:MAG: 50S ribosomal protein L13 [Ignavibacteria bacterium GWA2_35_9]|nr:MAG: 50S ribosomal protein L13 [Ignavibacteria bacterium GWA2_35_9]OGU44165.1 MAG: 50S ribosomal protein L13 [Ignavibacteria bacterium GWB2_36_8]OGU50240.1 MAG: 50S ribosomal protein L13 [Ignavibacteria bacterium GWC2_36_12]